MTEISFIMLWYYIITVARTVGLRPENVSPLEFRTDAPGATAADAEGVSPFTVKTYNTFFFSAPISFLGRNAFFTGISYETQ